MSGFLGAALFEHFSAKGYTVLGLTRESSSLWRISTQFHPSVVRSPIEDWGTMIVDFKPDTVICANWSGVGIETRENLEIQNKNIGLHIELATLSKKIGVRKFIAFGSQAEGAASAENLIEEVVFSGTSEYGKTKQLVFQEITEVFQNDWQFTWARVFSVYGPKDHPESLVSKLFASLSNKSISQDIVNENLYWSFLFIDDFCNAIETIANVATLSGVVNVGNSQLNTIGQARDIVLSLPPRTYNAIRGAFYPQIDKLNASSWSPSVDLEFGLAKTRFWYQNNYGLQLMEEEIGK